MDDKYYNYDNNKIAIGKFDALPSFSKHLLFSFSLFSMLPVPGLLLFLAAFRAAMGTILMYVCCCRCSMAVDGASWPRHFCPVVSDSLSCHEQWQARQLHDCSFLRRQLQQLSVVIGHPCARDTIQHFRSTVFDAEAD